MSNLNSMKSVLIKNSKIGVLEFIFNLVARGVALYYNEEIDLRFVIVSNNKPQS